MEYRIIAVDFDGTLCKNDWPDIGEPNQDVIDYVVSQKNSGAKIILWTNRVGSALQDAVVWCRDRGITFDAINNNLPEIIAKFGGDTRKVFANEYLDDRNIDITKLTIKEENKMEVNGRADILERARFCVCGEREQDYGSPENNFARIADLWNAYLGEKTVGPVDVAMMLGLLKIARIKTGTGTFDSFVDLAGYAACGGEIAANAKEKAE